MIITFFRSARYLLSKAISFMQMHICVNHRPSAWGVGCVFDLAELCWTLAEVEKWQGQRIADELGWSNTSFVSNYKNIKEKLHRKSWDLARFTKNQTSVNPDMEVSVNREFTNVNWTEGHFRAFLSALPYTNGNANRATMRSLHVSEGILIAQRGRKPWVAVALHMTPRLRDRGYSMRVWVECSQR